MVWHSHLFQNFPQFIVIHTVKGFGVVNKAEMDVILELSCFFNDPVDVGNLISGFSAFSEDYNRLKDTCVEKCKCRYMYRMFLEVHKKGVEKRSDYKG